MPGARLEERAAVFALEFEVEGLVKIGTRRGLARVDLGFAVLALKRVIVNHALAPARAHVDFGDFHEVSTFFGFFRGCGSGRTSL